MGLAGRMAGAWINSKLTPLFIVASLLVGTFSVVMLPREEEPQIIVPMIDIFVGFPGGTAREVEERVTKPMEKLLWEIPGVEYIYSTSSPGMAMAIVRFKVGEDEEKSIVKLNQKMYANFDLIPPGATPPLIKPRSIDDVPILALTLHSKSYSDFQLRQVAAQLHDAIKQVGDVSEVTLLGGQRRELRVTLDAGRLASYNLSPMQVVQALQVGNQVLPAGRINTGNAEVVLEAGGFLRDAADARALVVAAHQGRPVYLRDIAEITDGGEEPAQYVRFGAGEGFEPAVTIAIAKRKGTNAITVAEDVLTRVEAIRGRVIPADVEFTITRHYGETAAEKSNELLFHMAIAVFSVSLLIAFVLGRRESLIVFIAIPVTLALTLTVFYLYGYTLNRITLFALIFSIGILVDDAIVVVENVVRHARMAKNRNRPMSEVAVEAVDEVGNPTILATLAVIAAILPMAFVGGLMGPYMRPIPIGATAAMIFSLIVAFLVTPWAAIRLLKNPGAGHGDDHEKEDKLTVLYRRWMDKLIHVPVYRWGFLGVVAVLLVGSMGLVYIQWVKVKMLPFDNKSEFQVIIDLPEGTTLEQTARVTRELAEATFQQPEVVNAQTYVGTASPYNFNGLVRHYFLRRGANMADIQVNLLPKHDRSLPSHEIAKQVRERLVPIAREHGARIKVAEVPPGPPVLQTLVAEVYGPTAEGRNRIAGEILNLFDRTEGVVDADWYVEDNQDKLMWRVDREKAALHGITTADIAQTLSAAAGGMSAGLLHVDAAKEDIPVTVRLDRATRSDVERLKSLRVAGRTGALVPLAELVQVEKGVVDRSIYHKNLMPVTYVTADIAGVMESPVYAILQLGPGIAKIPVEGGYEIEQFTAHQPGDDNRYSMKWDGEWHITYEVFRDLGIAFAAVLVLIYVLVVGWFESFMTPLIIMAAIPFSLVGILPAHGMLGAFFTATSMIGFIAGAGIVVRNSIILVDFIELRLKEGMPLDQAVIDAGAVRFRPMMLTAAAVVVAAGVILFDPIFQGLAIALMAGEIASLALSRVTVPIVYYMANKRRQIA
ncbi:MAG: efflux RND transporter permease subunit [Bryobacteraceae bacterium]|nr:efflux RND transporter permease subunit [Solibacteraceae bacterium]MCL4793450.1 efflux RND transporter permease subunit [Bryobacteraceae bacterium]